jgi:DNA-directed RNA polymerase specialized sigma24 family protein
MLVGEGEQSVRLVEEAVAKAEISVCNDPVQARQSSRRALAVAALAQLAESRMGCLAAPVKVEQMVSCIDDDDLGAAGISSAELEVMISGPEREQLRLWLAGLPIRMRAVFVLRAVGGFTAAETAALLSAHGGTDVAGWSLEAVRMVFRQGLCLLASQLLQASSVK